MRFMLMLYADERAGDTFSTADMERAMEIMGAYNDVLKKAGAFVMTAPLQRSYEANLRMFDQARQMTSDLLALLRR